jgi:hypothetical protein
MLVDAEDQVARYLIAVHSPEYALAAAGGLKGHRVNTGRREVRSSEPFKPPAHQIVEAAGAVVELDDAPGRGLYQSGHNLITRPR